MLRERGGELPVEKLSGFLGRPPEEIRGALGGMGVAPTAAVPSQPEPFVGCVLFSILVGLFILVPLVWWNRAADCFLLPKALLLTTLSLAALCVWLAGLLASGEARVRRSPLYPVVALFALSLLPGCFHSVNPWLTLDALAWHGVCVLVLFLASSFSLTASRGRLIARVLLVVAVVESAYAVCQYFGWEPVFHVRTWDRAKIFGTFGNANFLSAFLAACLPLALVAVLGPGRTIARFLAGIACAVIPAGILVTGTRGSMLAAVVSAAFVLAYGFSHRRTLGWRVRSLAAIAIVSLLGAGAVLLVSRGGIGAFSLSSRFAGSGSPAGVSAVKRVLYWKSSWQMIRARPLAGWGPGTYRLHYLDNQARVLARPENAAFVPIPGVTLNAHNDYIELWAESGPLALLSLLALIAVVIVRGIRGCGRGGESGIILGFLGGFVSLAVSALVCFPLHRAAGALLFWSFAGMIAAAPEGGRGWVRIRSPRAVSVLFLAASCAVLLFAAHRSLVRLRAERCFILGATASGMQRWHDAAVWYRRGLAICPRCGEARINLGIALFRAGRWDEAIAELREAFREARDFNGHLTLADAFNEKGDMAQAVEEYRRVLFLNPGDGRALNNLGVCLSRQGRDAEAVAIWERGAERHPPSPDCLTSLAYYYRQKGDFAKAKRCATESLNYRNWGNSAAQARRIVGGMGMPGASTPAQTRTGVPPVAAPAGLTPKSRTSLLSKPLLRPIGPSDTETPR